MPILGLGPIGLVLLGLLVRAIVPGVIGHTRETGAFYYPWTAWFGRELEVTRFPL